MVEAIMGGDVYFIHTHINNTLVGEYYYTL